MVVAIDGPAGAGKSTTAKALARRLGFTYLDTGAMYRAVALTAARRGVSPVEVAEQARFEMDGGVRIDGRDVAGEIRTPEVSELASRASTDPGVRRALVERQRELVASGDWVAEGRDIGTVVAPDAAVKVFLVADPHERARRRARELGADAAAILAEQTVRDERDRTRAASPLAAASDAVELDTTGLSVDEVVDRIVALVERERERRAV